MANIGEEAILIFWVNLNLACSYLITTLEKKKKTLPIVDYNIGIEKKVLPWLTAKKNKTLFKFCSQATAILSIYLLYAHQHNLFLITTCSSILAIYKQWHRHVLFC